MPNLYVSFTGGNKTYDKTLIPGPISYTLSGIVVGHPVTILSYNSSCSTINIGYSLINITNIVLSTNYYTLQSFTPLYANISPLNANIIYYYSNKVYDGQLISIYYAVNYPISNDVLTISNFINYFNSYNANLYTLPLTLTPKQLTNVISWYDPTISTFDPDTNQLILWPNQTFDNKLDLIPNPNTNIGADGNSIQFSNLNDYLTTTSSKLIYGFICCIRFNNQTMNQQYLFTDISNNKFFKRGSTNLDATYSIVNPDNTDIENGSNGSIWINGVLHESNGILNNDNNNIVVDLNNNILGVNNNWNYYTADYSKIIIVYVKFNNPSTITIGNSNNNLSCILYDFITFNSNHTDYDRVTMEGYLATKYYFNKYLPCTHPYYNTNPSGFTSNLPIITGNYSYNYSFTLINQINCNIYTKPIIIDIYGGNKLYDGTILLPPTINYVINNTINSDNIQIFNSNSGLFSTYNYGLNPISLPTIYTPNQLNNVVSWYDFYILNVDGNNKIISWNDQIGSNNLIANGNIYHNDNGIQPFDNNYFSLNSIQSKYLINGFICVIKGDKESQVMLLRNFINDLQFTFENLGYTSLGDPTKYIDSYYGSSIYVNGYLFRKDGNIVNNGLNLNNYNIYYVKFSNFYNNHGFYNFILGNVRNEGDFNIKDLIFLNINHTDDDRVKLEGFLAYKYNLYNKLIYTHPFYSIFNPSSLSNVLNWYNINNVIGNYDVRNFINVQQLLNLTKNLNLDISSNMDIGLNSGNWLDMINEYFYFNNPITINGFICIIASQFNQYNLITTDNNYVFKRGSSNYDNDNNIAPLDSTDIENGIGGKITINGIDYEIDGVVLNNWNFINIGYIILYVKFIDSFKTTSALFNIGSLTSAFSLWEFIGLLPNHTILDQQYLEGYLSYKYNIPLPIDHPYYSLHIIPNYITGNNIIDYTFNIPTISATIYESASLPLYIYFSGGDKIYDKTLTPGLITYTYSGIVPLQPVYISSYSSSFLTYNIGYNLVTISDIVLSNNNYILQPVTLLYANINSRPLTLNFYGGNKIYDSTLTTGTLSYTISNLINTDSVTIDYTALFNTYVSNNNFINFSNYTVSNNNYIINTIPPLPATIYPRTLDIQYSNTNKIYDSNIFLYDISYNLINTLPSDPIYIYNISGYFNTSNVGLNTVSIPINIKPSLLQNVISWYDPNKTILNNNQVVTWQNQVITNPLDLTANGLITTYNYTSNLKLLYLYNGNSNLTSIKSTNIYGFICFIIFQNNYQTPSYLFKSSSNLYFRRGRVNNTISFNDTLDIDWGVGGILALNGKIYDQDDTRTDGGNNSLYYDNTDTPVILYVKFPNPVNTTITINYNTESSGTIGYIGDFIFLNSHTINDQQMIEGYLAIKYNLQNKLPNTHPYYYNYASISGQINNYNFSTNNILYTTGNIYSKYLTTNLYGNSKTYDGNTNATISYNILNTTDLLTLNYQANFTNPNYGFNKNILVNNITLSGNNSPNYTTISSGITTGNIYIPINIALTFSNDPLIYNNNNNIIITTSSLINSNISGNLQLYNYNNLLFQQNFTSDASLSYNISSFNVNNYNFQSYFYPNNPVYTNGYNSINKSIIPVFYYTISNTITSYNTSSTSYSIQPIINPNGGIFTISSTYNILSIDTNGIIAIKNNKCCNLITPITYTFNNISANYNYNILIYPNLIYTPNNITNNYGTTSSYNTIYYSPLGGNFNIYDISGSTLVVSNYASIDNSGNIIFSNQIAVGNYYLLVNYSISGLVNTTISQNVINYYNVIPSVDYSDKVNSQYYPITTTYSNLPTYGSSGGIFTISDYIGNLVSNNLATINNSTGLITFNSGINISNNSILVNYSVNNLMSTVIYNFIVKLYYYYQDSPSTIVYNNLNYTSQKPYSPYFQNLSGLFSLDTSNNYISIDNLGQITFKNGINVGYYNLNVGFIFHNVLSNSVYNTTIIPYIDYLNNNVSFPYGKPYQSIIPVVNPNFGTFSFITYQNNMIIDISNISINTTGIISVNNTINIGTYQLKIYYAFTDISNNYLYNFTVVPSISYSPNNLTINYNDNTSTNTSNPAIYVGSGYFTIESYKGTIDMNLVNINSSNGIITFSLLIPVGNYQFLVKFNYDSTFVSTIYYLIMKPFIKYNVSYINSLNYDDYFYSDYPILSPSGGIINYYDISNNLILYNYIYYDSSGLIYFNKNPNVGIYNLKVLYTVNDLYNSVNFVFYINPTINYFINSNTIIYQTNTSSIVPTYQQLNGYFTISNKVNGINIDISSGIINFSNVNIGNYSFIVNYFLNSLKGSTNYYLKVIPSLIYDNTNIINYYGNLYQTNLPNYNPKNGQFSIVPYSGDISASSYAISNNIIHVDSSGIIYFENNLNSGIYNLLVYYKTNDISNNSNFILSNYPNINYSPNYLNINYGTISNSVYPVISPNGGTFIATLSSNIELLETGITIDNNGRLYFNGVGAGIWDIYVQYNSNNLTTIVPYTLTVISSFYYNPCYTIITNSNTYITNPPINYNYNGIYTISETISGVIINSNTGSLSFSNVNVGLYKLNINYIDNITYSSNYYLLVKPSLTYNSNVFNELYGTNFSLIPTYEPKGGLFTVTLNNDSLPSFINYNSLLGIIYFSNVSDVNTYNLNIDYSLSGTIDGITYPFNYHNNINIIVNVNPNLYYSISNCIVNYGTLSNSITPYLSPSGGIFNYPSLFNIDSYGIIYFSNILDVSNYIIPITYTFNSLTTNFNYNLTVIPTYYYDINYLDVYQSISGQSIQPIALQKNGVFNFISVSGTNSIKYVLSDISNYLVDGIVLDKYTGIITFGTTINIGYYNLILSYTLNNLTNQTNYNFSSKPYLNYDISNYYIAYNINSKSYIPTTQPINGNFYFSDYNNLFYNNINSFSINQSGVIYFSTGLDVGLYTFYVNYFINNIITKKLLTLTVKPIYYYNPSITNANYGIISYSTTPYYLQTGGEFSIYDYSNLNDYISIDSNGIITFLPGIPIGTYTIKSQYNLNNSNIITNYNLIVSPFINYLNNLQTIIYGTDGYSEIPYILYKGGVFTFKNISSLLFLQEKLFIDSTTGQLYFAKYINVGSYLIVINYHYLDLDVTFNYYLNVVPEFVYSNLVFNYSDLSSNYFPISLPIKGKYYFYDNSSNIIDYTINEYDGFNLNINTGNLSINDITVNNYNINISYYLKDFVVNNKFNVQIIPYFKYDISSTILNYSNNTTNSSLPIVNPIEGIFGFINLSNTLVHNINIDNNGMMTFNNYTPVNNYTFQIAYQYNFISSIINYNLIIEPTFYYNISNSLFYYGNYYTSPSPNINPNNGSYYINSIETITEYNNTISYYITNSIDGITIENGQIIFSDYFNIGDYIFNLSYVYSDISAYSIYTVKIAPNINYTPNYLNIIYNTNGNSVQPTNDSKIGSYSINSIIYNDISNYTLSYIIVDISSGILYFNNMLDIGNYNINVQYIILDIVENIQYNLNVLSYIKYDISNYSFDYQSTNIIPSPVYYPINGIFTINYGVIDNSGNIYCDNLDVNTYNLTISYTINNVTNYDKLNLKILPIINYNNSITNPNLISTVPAYSVIPTLNPLPNTIILYDASNNNPYINTDISLNLINGQLTFKQYKNPNNYNIYIRYYYNNVTSSFNYYFNFIPYIYYSVNTIYVYLDSNNYFYDSNKQFIGSTANSVTPDLNPINGSFSFELNNSTTPIDLNTAMSINSNGVITFNNNFKVGIYNIYIYYSVNNQINKINFNLTINNLGF